MMCDRRQGAHYSRDFLAVVRLGPFLLPLLTLNFTSTIATQGKRHGMGSSLLILHEGQDAGQGLLERLGSIETQVFT